MGKCLQFLPKSDAEEPPPFSLAACGFIRGLSAVSRVGIVKAYSEEAEAGARIG